MSKKIDTLKTYMSKMIEAGEVNHLVNRISPEISLKNRNHFNWWLAIKYAENNFDKSWFHGLLVELASSWVTCACGNQCYILPRNREGAPKDKHLHEQGKNFYTAIYNRDWAWAKACLYFIEKRSAELIDEEIERGQK